MLNIDPDILASRSLYIAGQWHVWSGGPLVSTDPATGAVNAGFNQSGLVRKGGARGLRQYQQTKSVFLGISTAALTFDR